MDLGVFYSYSSEVKSTNKEREIICVNPEPLQIKDAQCEEKGQDTIKGTDIFKNDWPGKSD